MKAGRIFTTILAAVFAVAYAAAATVVTGGGKVVYTDTVPDAGIIEITFENCMANELFTFSEVKLNGTTVNKTSSDNIGPFGLAGGGWSGGNHLNDGRRSAFTSAVFVAIDEALNNINFDIDSVYQAQMLIVSVTNMLYMPDGKTFLAEEVVFYKVSGNTVDVSVAHYFQNKEPVTVDRYYGMQSMFIGETEILTPGAKYRRWTPITEVDRFPRKGNEAFTLFVEHSPAGYQAAWLNPLFGTLGDRHLVDDDDWVFIGNSYTKSYHKTIGNKTFEKGTQLEWHGMYSWFDKPIMDTEYRFAYRAYTNDIPFTFVFNKINGAYEKTGIKNLSPF